MKPWLLAYMFTSLALASFIRHWCLLQQEQEASGTDRRYAIDEFLTDLEL